ERGVDIEASAAFEDAVGVLVEHVAGVVDEVRRLVLDRPGGDAQRLVGGGIDLSPCDGARLEHRVENHVTPIPRTIRMTLRCEARGGLDESGNRRRFGNREIPDVLAEKDPCRLRYAVNGKRTSLAEHDVVEVELENFVLGEFRL